jgi:hypothetical protein
VSTGHYIITGLLARCFCLLWLHRLGRVSAAMNIPEEVNCADLCPGTGIIIGAKLLKADASTWRMHI